MTDGLTKQFHNYLWAYILVALSGCLGNVVDGIIVGNLICADGVSAINISKPINQFIFTLQLLINAGGGMLVAYALGQDDIREARRIFTRAFMLSMGLGILLGGIIAENMGYGAAFWTVALVNALGAALFFLATKAFFLQRRLS